MHVLRKGGLRRRVLLSCGQGACPGRDERLQTGRREMEIMTLKTHAARDETSPNSALIISYSYSGHTHQIAQALQSLTGVDWCEIYPWQPYPVEFPDLLQQVQGEVKRGYRPRLLPGARAPRPYSVIFAGTPNWCGTIAPPLASWLSRHDLSGKLILPFYSHCGGVAGDLAGDIAALCPRAAVGEALSIIGAGGEALPELLRQWLQRVGMGSARAG